MQNDSLKLTLSTLVYEFLNHLIHPISYIFIYLFKYYFFKFFFIRIVFFLNILLFNFYEQIDVEREIVGEFFLFLKGDVK
jgi:hypothetical protein